MISIFLIDYLKIVSSMSIKQGRKNSRVVKNGIDALLHISVSKLALGKQVIVVLNNLVVNIGFQIVFKGLGELLVMQGISVKKKNRKYVNRWLEQNVPQEFIGNQYYQLKQAINRKKIEAPPSVINIPSYQ